MTLKFGGLFEGYGGLTEGVRSVLGGEVAWHSEIDPGACKILAHRYPGVPNIGDITKVDWSAVEPVDVLTGGFPCQDVSAAGKRLGMRPGTRSGLWSHMAYAIDQLRPSLVVAENVRGLLSAGAHSDLEPCPWCVGDDGGVPLRALGGVLGDLADLGYDASWQGLRASDVGAPHGRFRVFVIAWPAADADRFGYQWRRSPRNGRPRSADSGNSFANSRGFGGERRRGHRDLAGPTGASEGHEGEWQRDGDATDDRGAVATHSHAARLERREPAPGYDLSAWGPYADAVSRWERLTRPAPAPTKPNHKGQPRLSAEFTEWMMGLPAGHVTQVPGLSRNEQLKALGNGVVPAQAAEALRLLVPDIEAAAA